jgi:hypothetical protein
VDTSKLAPDTRRVWEGLAAQPALRGFVLIGGTALAMQIGHRVSEDLGFLTVERRLPREAMDALLMRLGEAGLKVVRNDNQAAYEEFLIAGESLHDHQQDLLVDGVKVSLVAPYPHWAGALERLDQPLVRVASLPELFRLKALAAAERRVSRDRIDLYFLFKEHGFTVADFEKAFRGPDIHYPERAIAQAFENLCSDVRSPSDPGYETLMQDPPSREVVAKFFVRLRDEYQIEQARKGFEGKKGTSE